ncbi:DNA-processing protein DprA [Flavobacterium sp. CYK-55]|uniref:DNA-processing protein DprA n=1 Tax=Flavobacterium sp. CYK-55 TaxID=2835529 RepID=UPI001BCF5C41|nr:DNA-processing protein DprA [Flavobacterium sp. CYK-55]MBS7787556.1 DNA-processing protein DprA [Flavobacterium sp. CYK-55]
MRHEDLFYVLALLKVEGVGGVYARKLLENYPSPSDIFTEKPKHWPRSGIRFPATKSIDKDQLFKAAEAELLFIEQNQITTTYFKDADYPSALEHCTDAPVLLFSKGHFNFKNRKIISIVGTRQATAAGIEFCRQLISDLAPLDPMIVSGYAYGIDIAAHVSALENNLTTVGVLAHGLDQIYPKKHQKYAPQMFYNGGFLTEFTSDSQPLRENFIRRNRIVAGLSEATIVVESAMKGGSLITAQMANDYGREVFAVPGRVNDTMSQGCHQLIKTHRAQILTSAADLVYQLNWDLKQAPKIRQKQLFFDLEPSEQKVYEFLKTTGKEQIDWIARGCEIPIYELSSLLLQMELKGLVTPLPGKYFEAIV